MTTPRKTTNRKGRASSRRTDKRRGKTTVTKVSNEPLPQRPIHSDDDPAPKAAVRRWESFIEQYERDVPSRLDAQRGGTLEVVEHDNRPGEKRGGANRTTSQSRRNTMYRALDRHAESEAKDVLKACIKVAKEGDTNAQRLILERVYPKPSANQVPLTRRLDIDLSNAQERQQAPVTVLHAALNQEIGLGEADALLSQLKTMMEMDVVNMVQEMQHQIDEIQEQLTRVARPEFKSIRKMNGERPVWGVAAPRAWEEATKGEVIEGEATRQ